MFRLPVKICGRSRPGRDLQIAADPAAQSLYPSLWQSHSAGFDCAGFFPGSSVHLWIVSSRLDLLSLFVLGNVMWDSVKSLNKSRYMTCTYSFLSARPASLSEKEITIVWHDLFLANPLLAFTHLSLSLSLSSSKVLEVVYLFAPIFFLTTIKEVLLLKASLIFFFIIYIS